MKHILILSCFLLLLSSLGHAQHTIPANTDSIFKNYDRKFREQFRTFDGRTFKKRHQPFSYRSFPGPDYTKKPVDIIPNAYARPVPLTYLGNNNKGFSLYRSGIDNMTVLKPDSAFYSAMPVIPGGTP